ncbi:MAG: hypothetical protein EPN70_10140 [Paraburkholderia sp.]|uniref:hypothetical protein n=1 Tax=Paraburkholderia sp. TaxID=1926495 RepID=UPI001204EE37|nr:hypothetical protein [Paraburkholderia sp.]TAM04915.1 MAG: hypothetical protein EPN70_10140 [Paraburkholderia sp.]TAM29581.1 MAG: hypothetical protein EPN59_11575 [Paraburkholderia sp.]
MSRSHPSKPSLASAMPSITATEFAAWLIAPKAIGPCPWSIGHADPSVPQPHSSAHDIDEAVADIEAIMNEIDL